MKIIASYNIKGGVGKTATAVNLAYLAAAQGLRTLVWDLDPQGAASFYFRIKPRVKKGARGLIEKKRALDEVIKSTDYARLDLIPATSPTATWTCCWKMRKIPSVACTSC